jgi:hypothetical protein
MAFDIGLSVVSDVRSGTSSRTLTPIGARPDEDLNDIEAGARTPPRQYIWSSLQDECQVRDTGFPKKQSSACDFGVDELSIMQDRALSSSEAMPGPMKTMITMTQVAPAPSKGSVGHPYTCGSACKYVRRKGGCIAGDSCDSCHLCHWSRNPAQQKPAVEGLPIRVAVDVSLHDDVETDEPPSVGSIGHPFSCNIPCKFQSKKNKAGCKDGKLCSRCHLCHWRRSYERTTDKEDNGVSKSFAPESQGAILQGTSDMFLELNYFRQQRVEIERQPGSTVPMYVTLSA